MCLRTFDQVLKPRDFFGDYGLMGVDSRYRIPNGLPVGPENVKIGIVGNSRHNMNDVVVD